ncbi:deoxyribodipyrimidine photo-lyase [Alkalimonas sp.]|uniref:deoxyribodipyrimidine photo-lyase n=1 Tax=Alkalimonas sp. TaxID=1872453 RepID=UPI00263A7E48|nr:deoxyribodipyrimidine photo-lyase [Alkalimonas sp.]MCC5824779.1 deoxyribodipyrimidine photo-lyase [Alkalimonas sp.]
MQLVWFRSDLRVYDNAALTEAMSHGPTLALFIACPQSWQQHQMAPIKQDLIRRRAQVLEQELAELNVPLLLIEGSSYHDVQSVFEPLLSLGLARVYTELEYELRERRRDQVLQEWLAKQGVGWWQCDRQCAFAPGSFVNGSGAMYQVFTPFKKRWLQRFSEQGLQVLAKPKPQAPIEINLPALTRMHSGDDCSTAWPVEQNALLKQLRRFCQQQVQDYKKLRDLPALDATSRLSPYLAIGAISVRQCIARLQVEAGTALQQADSGASVWLSELIWRDFYKHVLVAWPDLIKHQPFQAETATIRWHNDETLFRAWCDGKTGYPLVDAAMRQLNQTGWMHNRLRMVVASFLVKDLHIDWRKGEQYFMSRLIDGDFAANNGGWQWAASTGTDAAPYFRIFNPITQSERFDPEGDFIRNWVPELAKLPNQHIHWPHKLPISKEYPKAVVDHAKARQVTLELFRHARQQGEKSDEST